MPYLRLLLTYIISRLSMLTTKIKKEKEFKPSLNNWTDRALEFGMLNTKNARERDKYST